MRLLKIEQFPNREIRVSNTRSLTAKKFEYECTSPKAISPETLSSPTCHSRKTREGVTKPQPQGSLEIQGKPGWGGLPRFQRFSTYARRQILRAGGALEKFARHSECLFLTLTLPGSTKVSMEALARYSGMAVKMLHDWVGWHISSKMSIYTWELQKRGALHLHYVVWCPDKKTGEYIQAHLKEEWIRILDAIGEASGVDLYRKHEGFSWASNKEITRVDAQWCEKSVAAYLSKYVSKPNKFLGSGSKKAWCPSRWYGVSRPLLQKLREMTVRVSLDSLRDREAWGIYEDCLSLLQSFALKCYDYKHEVGDGRTVVAYVNSNEQDSIWTSVMAQTKQQQDSQSNIDSTLWKMCQNGVLLMRKHKTWFSTWKQFCGNYRPHRLISPQLLPDTTRLDLVYILDMLIYTYRYVERTRSRLPGECSLWYTKTLETIHALDSSGELGLRHLIPCNVLIRLDEEKALSDS